MPSRLPDYREAFLVAAEQCARQKAIIAAQNELIQWALGDGPLPVDEEAERAAWGYLWALAINHGYGTMTAFYRRLPAFLTTRCPDAFEVPTMSWSEALRRLREAAETRVAVGRTKQALRRAMAGDRVGMIRALRGAVDAFGEPKASAPVELQWRVAELETEIRALENERALARQ